MAIEADYQSQFLVSNMMTKAYIMTTIGEVDEALKSMDKALHYCEKENDAYELVSVYVGYGNILSEAGRHKRSLDFHRKAYSSVKDLESPQFLALVTLNMTTQFLELGAYDSAAIYADRGLLLSREIDNPVYSMDFYEMKADILYNRGDNKAAYDYLRKYIASYTEMINTENISTIENMESLHKLQLKDKDILLKDKEIKLLKIDREVGSLKIYALAGCVFFLLIFFILVYRSQKKKREQERRLEEAKIQLTQSELERMNLKEQQLIAELEYKNAELKNLAQNIVQTSDLLDNLRNELKSGGTTKSNKLIQLISVGMHTNKEEFEQKVDHIHSLFYKNIKDQFPDLRENDLRLLSLIRANMSSKDIAILLSINPKSVDMARYRLRKKMNLEKEVNLMEFLLKF